MPHKVVFEEPVVSDDDHLDLYDPRRKRLKETYEVKLSRRRDWDAFEDYDDDDSDIGEHLKDISGKEKETMKEQDPLDFGFICCPCCTCCVERKLNKGRLILKAAVAVMVVIVLVRRTVGM